MGSHGAGTRRNGDRGAAVIRFALLGLGLGAAYNLASQGLILVKRGSGVLNFAQGTFPR